MSVVSNTRSEAEVPVSGGDLGLSLFDPESTDVIDVVPITRRDGLLRRAWRKILNAVARVRAATIRSDVRVGAYVRRTRRAWTRTAAHRATRAERRRPPHQRIATRTLSRAADKEAELARCRWVDDLIETLRAEQDALHPRDERRFICS